MSRPTVGSLFSGAGGFDLGFEAGGFDVAWQVEIDKDCISVLERHWPDVPRWRDVSEVDPAELAPVDVVIFGSPCQDFSVAGKRAGLDGARSGLFGEAIRIISGLRPVPALCVWENVPGALSSAGGRDFGAVLDALADIGAVDVAWRVLDARHFGVPQRRRRIFLVADFGAERTGQVLFESEGGSGDSAACGAAGEGLAGDVEDGAGVVGVRDTAFTLRGNTNGTGASDNAWNTTYVPVGTAFGGNRTSGPLDVATACNAHGGPHGRQDFESETFIVADPVAFHMTQDPINGPESPALGSGNKAGCSTIAVAISENQRAEVATWDERNVTSPTNRNRVEFGKAADTLHAEGLSIVLKEPNTSEQLGYNTGTEGGACATEETRSGEVLRRMRRAIGEEAFQQWGLGVLAGIQSAEVLRAPLHGEELRCSPESVGRLGDDALPREEARAAGAVLGVLQAVSVGCSPSRRRSHEQLTRELVATLSELPHEAAQAAAVLHGLWEASEGLGVLRQALPALQEIRRPADVQAESAQSGGATARVANDSRKEVGGLAVRRLTPRLRECERLQGWPDDHTRYRASGDEISDGPRYRMIGNGVASPVAAWIARRIRAALTS